MCLSIIFHFAEDGFQLCKSNVEFLGLRSLKYVVVEKFLLLYNQKLCYLDNLTKRFHFVGKYSDRMNRNSTACKAAGLVCHPQCDTAGVGCWGPGDTQCVRCRNNRVGHRCVPDCAAVPGFYAEKGAGEKMICKRCHRYCAQNCTGPRADQCLGRCKHAKVSF